MSDHPESDPNQLVKVFDLKNGGSTLIPARELAQGMVEIKRVDSDGTEELGWVDAEGLQNLLQAANYRHEPFDEPTRDQLREIKAAIDEHYPLSLEEWEDGFRRDTHAQREIAMWLHLARTYRSLTAGQNLSEAQRRDYFRVVLSCLNSPREQILTVAARYVLSDQDVLRIVRAFYGEE